MSKDSTQKEDLQKRVLEEFLHLEVGIPAAEFRVISALFKKEVIPKGTFLVRQEGYSKKITFLLDGYVRCFFTNGKKQITHWVYWKGHLVNDIPSFYQQRPSKWNFQTLTDCEVFSLSYHNYLKISRVMPSWDRYEKLLIIKFFTLLENRVSTFLSMNSEERYHYLFKEHPELFNQIPLVYIASMLSMAPETLSRIRRKEIS